MKRLLAVVALLFVAGVVEATIPVGQELQTGNWTGTVEDPNGAVVDAVFVVSNADGLALSIEITEVAMTIDTIDPKLEGAELTFRIALDMDSIACTLQRDDEGAYAGDCIDQDGGVGHMKMMPPS